MLDFNSAKQTLSLDDSGIVYGVNGCEKWRVQWSRIRRIAYAIEDTSPAVTDDHFLAFETNERLYYLSLDAPGCMEVERELQRRFPFTMGPKGCLSDSTADDSVIVWPPSEVGAELVTVSAKERGETRVPVTYVLSG